MLKLGRYRGVGGINPKKSSRATLRSPKFVSKILCCVAFVYNSYFFRTVVLRKLSFIRFSYKHCNFSRGCLTRQDGFQNHDKVYFATNCLCLLLRCFLFIDYFILHGLIVGDRDKMSKKTIPEYRQNLFFNLQSPRRPGDELSLS